MSVRRGARRGVRRGVRSAALPLACLLAAATACSDATPGTRPAPNILLVSIDSLRADHLGCYGYERDTSPVIDRLAAEGVRFETVVSPTTWTLPAHATLFTGLPPEGHGLRVDATALAPEALCLAEVLGDAGYDTAAFVGGPFLRRMYGFDQGFDVYDDETVMKSFRESQHGVTSPDLVGLTRDWIEARDSRGDERPFFVFLHLWDVHFDYTPPPPYDTMFDPDYEGEISGRDFELGRHIHRDMDPRDLEHVVSLYDGEIRFTDTHLGALLDDLAARGLLDDTIVAITSDHGEEFFEHGKKGHRKNLFDETLLVPAVIRYPPVIPAGRVARKQVRLMDLPVTLLSLAGVERPEPFGSWGPLRDAGPVDLRPLIVDGDAAAENLVAFGDLQGTLTSVRADGFKLIREERRSGKIVERFYDLGADPDEQAQIEARTEGRDALADLLTDWIARWAGQRPASVPIELSDEQQDMLRALGYIR